MSVLSGSSYQSSQIKKMINPNHNISYSVEVLERLFTECNLFDEIRESFGSPFNHIFYKKDGEEVIVIGLNKSNYYMKLSGYKWNLAPFLSLPIEIEFVMDKTLSWKLMNLGNAETSQIGKALKESMESSPNLQDLMKYILLIKRAYVSKASFLNESAGKLKELVLEHFWKGELSAISQHYEKSTQSKSEQYNQFLNKWEEKLSYSIEIDSNQLSSAMDIGSTELNNLIKTIQVYLNQSLNTYIHSIKNLWFEEELLQDEGKFLDTVDEIRSMILNTKEFLKDMDGLFYEEETERRPKEDEGINEAEPELCLSAFLYEKPNSNQSIRFLNKSDIYESDPTLNINEKNLDQLASYIANGNKNKKEYMNVLRIIFNKSSTRGFTVKSIVKTFFMSKYDNEMERKDFEQRHDVKRLFVRSTLENVFENLMDKLKELNIIKEELSILNSKQQEKISFNYNYQIYDND